MSTRAAPLAAALLHAAHVVAAVRGGASADSALAHRQISGPLAAAARDLSYRCLRRYGRDHLYLARLIERPLAQPTLAALLLVALCRLDEHAAQAIDDAHTTVDQAVEAAAGIAQGRYSALVNAVLRNFLRRREALVAAATTNEVARLQHPAWWLKQLRQDWPQDWQHIATIGNTHPPMTLRVNRRHLDAAAYCALLQAHAIHGAALDDTAVLLAKPLAVSDLPGFAAGRVSVQDWGAQQAARFLNVCSGMRVLDACAAPGGKSGHLLEAADIELTALEIDPARAKRIEENLTRLKLPATLRVADVTQLKDWWDGRPFDRVLVDAPCSGSGVVRRHPDAKWLRHKSDTPRFARCQDAILEASWQTVVNGGMLLYCTCSVFAEENFIRIAAFSQRHPDAHLTHRQQIKPDAQHDGFFYATLAKA